MRKAILALSLLVAACAVPNATTVTTNGGTTMRNVSSGVMAARRGDAPEAFAAHDQATYERMWREYAGSGTPPAVAFPNEAAVFLLAGMRPTGGHSIVPKSVSREGTALVVDAAVSAPDASTIVTQALTYPWAVIAVSPGDFETVSWPSPRHR